MRGFVALLVVFHHTFLQFVAPIANRMPPAVFGILDFVQARNKPAVLTFFVLSGYAIALATRSAPPITRPAIGRYAFRRFARIVPLYWFALAWTALLGLVYGTAGHAFAWSTLAGNALFLQTSADARGVWFEPYGRNGPLWSLSYEVFYYALLPLALWLSARGQRASSMPERSWQIALGLAALIASLALNQVWPTPFSNFLGLWIVWLVGFAAFGVPHGMQQMVPIAVPALLAGLGRVLLATLGLKSATLDDAFAGCLIGLIFAFVALGGDWRNAWAARIVRRMFVVLFERTGRGSYALYLLHFPLLLALRALLPQTGSWVPLIACTAVLLPFALAVCPWLERESALVLRQFDPAARRRSQTAHEGPAT